MEDREKVIREKPILTRQILFKWIERDFISKSNLVC